MDRFNPIDPYGWFQWYFRRWLVRRPLDDERQINKWKGIISRSKGELVKMIKDVNGRFDDYSISPKIRQILLHCSYELVESDLLWFTFFVHIKWVIVGLIEKSYYKKQKTYIIPVVVKKKKT